jgi:hypothetical protein
MTSLRIPRAPCSDEVAICSASPEGAAGFEPTTAGSEEAALRLTELAAHRGDADELRRLVDGGSEEAAVRLTELAAKRGDVEEVLRLVDGGTEEAALRLVELNRDMK